VGWHVWHALSFSPFFRAQTDLAKISDYSDYLKITVYNNLGGTRMETYITSLKDTIYGDMPVDEALEFEYRVMNLRERGYESRVYGTAAPFRVRVGRYATEVAADAVERALKAKGMDGFVTAAEPVTP